MGLDLYHFRANADRRGDPLTIASTIPGAAEMRQKFDWCLEIIHNLQVDWEATFAAQNLDLAHYKTGPSTVRIDPRTDIETGVFVFKRRSWFGSAPKNVVFVSLDDKPDWEAVAVRKLSRPTVFRGPLATHRVPEIVVFVEQVGYQRKSVEVNSSKSFAPTSSSPSSRASSASTISPSRRRGRTSNSNSSTIGMTGRASSPSPGSSCVPDEIGHRLRLPRPAVFPAHNGAPRAARIAATAAGYRSD